jgi:hypothetical protein
MNTLISYQVVELLDNCVSRSFCIAEEANLRRHNSQIFFKVPLDRECVRNSTFQITYLRRCILVDSNDECKEW